MSTRRTTTLIVCPALVTASTSPGQTSAGFTASYVPATAAARLAEKLNIAAAALSKSTELRATGFSTLPSHCAVPGTPPAASAATLAASFSRATALCCKRYVTVTSSPATGTRPAKNVTLPVAEIVQSTPSPATPISRVIFTPLGNVLTTHAEPVCVTLQYPIDPISWTLFTATKLQLAGELTTLPSYNTVAGVFEAAPKVLQTQTPRSSEPLRVLRQTPARLHPPLRSTSATLAASPRSADEYEAYR